MKKKIMISFSKGGENGGPYVSHERIVESELSSKYDFTPFFFPRIRKLLNPVTFIEYVSRIKKNKPDIFHAHGLQFHGFLIVLIAKFAGVKNIITVIHGSTSESISTNFLNKKIEHFFEKMTLNMSTSIYSVSEYVSNLPHVKRYSNKSVGVIYNLPHESIIINQNDIRNEFGIKKDDIVIVSTGRITVEKGFKVLAESLLKINLEQYKNVKVLIVGEGDYLQTMESSLSNYVKNGQVVFTGYRDDVASILLASDIFVLCTLHETLSNSTIEAGQQGLPSVVSNIGGLPEIIKNGHNGYLVPINNSKKVSEALLELIKDEDKRKKMGINAKDIIQSNFNIHTILEKIDDLYQSHL